MLAVMAQAKRHAAATHAWMAALRLYEKQLTKTTGQLTLKRALLADLGGDQSRVS